MSVYGGSIGPRMPKMDGENCGNCGSVYVMQPGHVKRDGIIYGQWKCPGCNSVQEWAVGKDTDWNPEVETTISKSVEELENKKFETPTLPGQVKSSDFIE